MKKIIRYLCLLPLIFTGCDKSVSMLLVNPYDSASPYFIGNPVSGTQAETLSKTSVRLSWPDTSSYEAGYYIERSEADTAVKKIFVTRENQNYIVDTGLDISKTYSYKIGTKTNTGYFVFTDSVQIKYFPYYQEPLTLTTDNAQFCKNGQKVVSYMNAALNIYDDKFNLQKTSSPSRISQNFKLSYDGRYVVYMSYGVLSLYDIVDDKSINLPQASNSELKDIDISVDNLYVISSRADNSLTVINTWNNETKTFKAGYNIIGLKICPGNRFFAGGERNNSTVIRDMATFDEYYRNDYISAYAFSEDGNTFIFHDRMLNKIVFYDLNTKSISAQINDIAVTYINGLSILNYGKELIFWADKKVSMYKLVNNLPVVSTPELVYYAENGVGKMQSAINGDFIIQGNEKYYKYTLKDYWKLSR